MIENFLVFLDTFGLNDLVVQLVVLSEPF